jgi:hypothetical protein
MRSAATKTKSMTYSSSVSMTRRQYAGRNQNSVSFAVKAKSLGPVSNTIILIALTCLVGLLYLTQVTKTNNFGYTINNLQKQQADLKDRKADLEVTAARLHSFDVIAGSKTAKSLVPATPSGTISQ